MKKNDFMQIVDETITSSDKFIVVVILTRGNNAPEYIINPNENLQNKKEYYDNAYDENMVLKTCDGIKIIDVFSGELDNIKKAIENFENLIKFAML